MHLALPHFDIYKTLTALTSLRPSRGSLILAIFVVLALTLTFKQGKGGVVRSIVSVYMAIAVSNFLPFLNLEIKGFQMDNYPLIKVGIFVIIFLLISFMLSRSSLGLLDRDYSTFLGTLILAIFTSGLILSTITAMLPPDIKNELTGIAHFMFVNEIARFIWVVTPIIAVILIG